MYLGRQKLSINTRTRKKRRARRVIFWKGKQSHIPEEKHQLKLQKLARRMTHQKGMKTVLDTKQHKHSETTYYMSSYEKRNIRKLKN